MAEISGERVRSRQRLGWMDGACNGGLEQQKNAGGLRKNYERVERPGTYVTE